MVGREPEGRSFPCYGSDSREKIIGTGRGNDNLEQAGNLVREKDGYKKDKHKFSLFPASQNKQSYQ